MKLFKLITIIALLSPFLVHAQLDGVSYEWKERKNKNDIIISTSSVEDLEMRW